MSLLPAPLTAKAQSVIQACAQAGLTVACAESCTGGLVSAALTSISGSSQVVACGFVTYSNQSKHELLGVPEALIATHGAVSQEVACAMAKGALAHSNADVSVAVTGIAGPSGGSAEKPVGLVHFASARRGGAVRHRREVFSGDRDDVRLQAALMALAMLGGGE